MNKIPLYLRSLGRAYEPGESRSEPLIGHLSSRMRAGFRVADALEELIILGRCIDDAGRAPGNEALAPSESARLNAALREDTRTVVDAFTQYLIRDVQEEKQYLRRLQSLAINARYDHTDEAARARYLRAALELVMEAVEGQSAAILLHDLETRTLWMAASAGLSSAPFMAYVTHELAASLEAAVTARNGAAAATLDAETTEFKVGATLHHSGIHSLIGVRLPARRTLVGTLYVGMTERRSFTLTSVQRLESLGSQLAQQLDNVRFDAASKALVDDLRIERELRERFISVLAHDLRTPLAVIRTAAYLLNKDADSLGEHRELPSRTLRNVARADAMIRDLLDVLRIRAGHELPITLAECDLDAVTRTTCEELTMVYGERFVRHSAAPVRGIWSADALSRALWNLAANAVKYGASDSPIEVTVRSTDTEAEIAVHNQGPAIPEGELTTLFAPFAQRTMGAQETHPGWGVGLALVQSCAKAHGGVVEVTSTPGDGTTFTIRIPRDSSPFQPAA